MAVADLPADEDPLGRTIALLGGRRTLRRPVRSRLEAHDLLQQGLPGHALRHLVEHVALLRDAGHDGLEKAVGLSLRTWQRRRDTPDRPLTPQQSARTWTFAEILARASAVFGSQAAAEAWLEAPAMALDRRRPIDLLATPAGVQALQDHLTRMEQGVYT